METKAELSSRSDDTERTEPVSNQTTVRTNAPGASSFSIDPALPLDSVQITSLVLMKIIKHCQEDADSDADATGVLLGMALETEEDTTLHVGDRVTLVSKETKYSGDEGVIKSQKHQLWVVKWKSDGAEGNYSATQLQKVHTRVVNLEVTNCFGLPKVSIDSADDVDRFSVSMMKLFREVNVDNNNVGFFQSGNLSTTGFEMDIVTSLYQHQKDLKNNVVAIIYDPSQSNNGSLAIKAFRLSPDYMQILKRSRQPRDGSLPQSAEASRYASTSNNILQEIPIKIKDLSLARALVWDLQARNVGVCDRLDLSVNKYMRNSLEVLSASVDDTKADLVELSKFGRILASKKQDRFKWIQDRKHENSRLKKEGKRTLPEVDRSLAIFKPTIFKDSMGNDGRLRTRLSSKRVNATSEQINKFTGATFNKLYLASGFHSKH